MLWVFAFMIGYLFGHVPIHKVIAHFTKQTCAPTVLANITLKQYILAGGLFGWFFIMPFVLWYLLYLMSFNPQVATIVVTGFTVGNALPLWKEHAPTLQVYPFISLLFILSFKVTLMAIAVAGVVFAITRKPLKTRGYFVITGLLLLMLFPERLEGIFYILPVGILLFIADHAMLLATKERKWWPV